MALGLHARWPWDPRDYRRRPGVDLGCRERRSPAGHRRPGWGGLERFAASPDGQLIATSRDTVPVDLWDSSTGEHLAALWPDTGEAVDDLSWSQDGELLAIALFDGDGSWRWSSIAPARARPDP